MQFPYEPFIEEEMRGFYDSLPEDKKRRYAATEATRAGHGGTKYISELFGCDPKTVYNGQQELEATRFKKNHKNRREESGTTAAEESGSKRSSKTSTRSF